MTQASDQRLVALMFTDLVGSVALQSRLGTDVYTRFIRRHDEIFKSCLGDGSSAEILNETGDGFLVKFDSPMEAVNTALRLQAALHEEVYEEEAMQVRIGLHMGSITEMEEGVRGEKRAVGMAINLAARIMDLAEGGQILMTRAVFDEARQFVREHPNQKDLPESAVLQWPAHGRYIFKGNDDPLEIYEVGAEGMSPLSPPEGGGKAKRAVAADEEDTLGWRPGAGIAIPRMEDWVVEEKLGSGGFGEVWLAKHQTTKEERVFKFCFDPERLRSFRRELTLFRLLRDALGKRDDIAALYDVSIEMPPFYLESEYVPQGNLGQWVKSVGGLETISEETRIDLMARTARAVDAAHSVGIVHKDIKPSNILISLDQDEPRPRLADFGIGAVTDSSALSDFGITQSGFTQSIVYEGESSSNSMTQLYAPPEYLVGGQADPKGDIYSLGVMLYQLAAGDLQRPLASGWRRDIAEPLLSEIIENCVDVDPGRRFETAGQLAEKLETLEERRVQKQEHERLEELRAQAKKRRRMLVAGGLVCGGSLALSAVLATSYLNQKRLTEDQKRLTQEAVQLRVEARKMASASDFLLASQHIDQDRRSTGLAFLARSLRNDPSNRLAASKLVSTLATHRFERPVFPSLQIHEGNGINRAFFGVFDPQMERVVAQNLDGELTIFDLSTATAVGKPFDHSGEFPRHAAFVDGGTKLMAAVVAENGAARLKLWDIAKGTLIRQEPQGDDSLRFLSMARDGSHWVVVKLQLDTPQLFELQVWDLSDVANWKTHRIPNPIGVGLEFLEFVADAERFTCISVSADAQRHINVLDVAGLEPDQWENATWQDVATLGPWIQSGFRPPAVIARDGRRLAVPEVDGTLHILNLDERKLEREIEKPDTTVVSFNFSPSGERIAVGYFESGTSTAVVWDLALEQQMLVRPRHAGGISGVAISPDGNSLLTGSMDGTARLWDIESGRPLTERLEPHNGWVVYTGFTEDGARMYSMSMGGTINVWKRGGSTALPTPMTLPTASPHLQFWSLAHDGTWMSGNPLRGTEVTVHRAGGDEPQMVSVEAPILATIAGPGHQLFIQNIIGRNPERLERVHLQAGTRETFTLPDIGAIFTGDFSDDGNTFIVPSQNRLAVYVWRLISERPEAIRLPHPQTVSLASLSGDGRRAVTASIGQTFLWDLEQEVEGEPTPRFLTGAGSGFTFSHALDRDGSKVLTGAVDGGVRLWDFETGAKMTRDFGHPGPVVAIAFSPDETLVAALAVNQRDRRQFASVAVWDLATEEALMEPVALANSRLLSQDGLVLDQNSLPQVRFSPDATQLIVAFEDKVSTVDVAPTVGATVPDWLPQLGEVIGGSRLLDGGLVATSPDSPVNVPDPSGDSSGNQLEDWAAWLRKDAGDRSISPRSTWSLKEFGDYLVADEDANLEDLRHLAPGDPRALAGLALKIRKQQPQRAANMVELAEKLMADAEFAAEVKSGVYSQLAQAALDIGGQDSLRNAVRLAAFAIEADPDDLDSRFTLASALDRLSADQKRMNGDMAPPGAQLAGVWFEILFFLGWNETRSTLDRGFTPGLEWKYEDSGVPQEPAWTGVAFNDAGWKSGTGPFGFGDENERKATHVDSGKEGNRPLTTYFRKSFQIDHLSDYAKPLLKYQRDDGVVIYINGQEVARDNMPEGEVTFDTLAPTSKNLEQETEWISQSISPDVFQRGNNVIAVEVHQNKPTSSDLWFELELFSNPGTGADLLRGDGADVEELLEQAPELPATQKDDIRAVFAEEEAPNGFTILARAVRAHLQGDAAKAGRLVETIPTTPEGEQASPLAAAKAKLQQVLNGS